MKTRVVWVLLTAFAAASSKADPRIESDVIYGHKDGMALIYDVFVPEAPNGAGVLYMVSGGWFSVWREPAQRLRALAPLLGEGFTVFAIHHGSAPRFKVPDAVSDVRAAVRHVKRHAADYGVDPARLGVWGGSAGGHLSLMLGLDPEGKPNAAEGRGFRRRGPSYSVDGNDDARIAAVVAYYPPVDLRRMTGPNDRFPALDFPKAEAAALSPVLFATKDDPPVRLIHGDADDLVPVGNSRRMKKALAAAGVEHDALIIEGGDHGFRDPEHRARATDSMVAWFKEHLLD